MKLLFCFCITMLWHIVGFSQSYFDFEPVKGEKYIILANPTVYNIKTVRYLVGHKILRINPKNTHFVGLFHEKQAYDFSESEKYAKENKLDNFHFLTVKGNLTKTNIFEVNDCTPIIEKAFRNSSGVFFFGGPDIQPEIYLEKNVLSEVTDPGRHLFETTFLFHLLGSYRNNSYIPLLENKPEYLVTGFCLGMQTMNVATGGTLIQDIPSEIYQTITPEETLKNNKENLHRNYWQEISDDTLLMGINFHSLKYTSNSFFTDRVKVSKKIKPLVLSSHHQAIEKVGKGLIVAALSTDGKIIEGLVHEKYPNVFAVQFHPEVPSLYEDLNLLKFSPGDKPQSYNDIIGKKSVIFHKKYWKNISRALK